MDNADPDRPKLDLKEFNFGPVPHPCSPSLAASDFYPFGAIKGKMTELELGSAEEPVYKMSGIASFVSHIALANVFCEWEYPPQKCIDLDEDCID
jgi:hypothetical protein